MKKPLTIFLLAGLFFSVTTVFAAPAEPVWEVKALAKDGEFEFDPETKIVTATQGVQVNYNGAELTATHATLNQETGDITADGMVTLLRDNQLWRGEWLEYNFKTKVMKAERFKAGMTPFFVTGIGLRADPTNRVHTAMEAQITTDDLAEPGYKIRARTLILVPGHSFEARHATFYLGNVPVFYWPRYARTFGRHPNNLEFTPGFRTIHGPYLLGTYNWYANEKLSGAFHLDYRQKRGVGFGPDLNYDLGRWGKGEIQTYFTRDEAPGTNTLNRVMDDKRHRLSFSHQATLRTNLTATLVVREQTDPFVIRDFFEHEYRRNIQPSTFLEVNQLWQNWSLNVLAQPQVNDFFETVERLPDVKLTGVRQQIGVTPVYYESESSAGYYRHQFADNVKPEFVAWRADSYHQLLLPYTFFGWLNVSPRVGGRFTHYGETEGTGFTTTEKNRAVFNTGAEVTFKASRIWAGAQNKFLDVQELRHIVSPSINYVFVPSPNVLPPQLPQFDIEQHSLRLLPIEYPDYNAIDSIDSQNVLRFGLHNKLQTKRQGQIENLLNWELYTDWRLKPRTGQATFADLFSDLDFQPRSWLTFNSETRYDISNGVFKQANHNLVLSPQNFWSVSLGHRYIRADAVPGPNALGNNLVYTSLYYRLNENWGARMTHHFEARDGRMEEQFYTLYRDLRSWTAALTFRVRDSRVGKEDYTVAVTFSLKAFPRFKLGHDRDTPSLLLGG